MDRDPHMDDDQDQAARELAHRLATDPNAIPRVIALLPDPRAVTLLKALAPGIADMHRWLTRLEALHRVGRLTRRRPHEQHDRRVSPRKAPPVP